MTQYDPTKHGTESKRKGSTELLALWNQVPVSADPKREGIYWPIEAIWFDNDISPRANGRTDQDTVERYSQILDQLPPIQVRKRTGQLIDGKHRLEATALAGLKHIRVVEVDCTDDELFELAFLANNKHGLGYTNGERTTNARRIWDAMIARGETPNQTEFANKYGISRRTTVNWAQAARGGTEKSAQSPKASKAATPKEVQTLADELGADVEIVARDGDGNVLATVSATPSFETPEPEYAPPGPLPEPADDAPKIHGQSKFADVASAILEMADFEDGKTMPADFLDNLPGAFGAQLGVNEITAASRWLSAAARVMRVRSTAKGE